MLDNEQMRQKYFELTGIKLSVDDPIFSVGHLTEVVVGQLIENLQSNIQTLPDNLAKSVKTYTAAQQVEFKTSLSSMADAVSELPEKLDILISEKIQKIDAVFSEAEAKANKVSDEKLNEMISAQAEKLHTNIIEKLDLAIAPIGHLCEKTEKLKQDVHFLYTYAHKNKPTLMPILVTGILCVVLAGAGSFLGMQAYQAVYVHKLEKALLRQDEAYKAGLTVLSKGEAAKFKKVYSDRTSQPLSD